MPNHVHLLLSEPKHHLLSYTLRAVKTLTSRKFKGDRKQFWQLRYHDRNIITQTKFVEKVRYIHRNPVEDWPRRKARKLALEQLSSLANPN